MFDPVSPNVSFPALDSEWLARWEERRIFEKTVEGRKDRRPFVFYEGPPTANGMPHPGHVLTRVMKDVFLRYRTMCGDYVPRRGGWDTHGLPVEVEVEKDLGISGRAAIAEYGVEAFSKKCVESVFRYIDEWRRMTQRIGFWVDLDAAYVTFHKSYVESVWWALQKMFDEGLLYQGYKVVWWWPQGGTALSAGEVGQGYQEVDDPSIFVRFPVVGEEGTPLEGASFLAWTTTPWTLPSNVALAVKADEVYDVGTFGELPDHVVMSRTAASSGRGGGFFKPVASYNGRDLVGKKYRPPFDYVAPEGGRAHEVIAADFVTLDTGSGMVHLAPAFGEDDFRVCKEEAMGFLQLVKPDGTFPPEVTDFAGRFCKDADRDIIRNLRDRKLLEHEERYKHDYPFCWRKMSDPLIQYARRSWFIRTTARIGEVKANNQTIHWEPDHIKDGRFGQFLEGNVDWALSRERFWGTPLPIWVNDATGKMEAAGSVAEILARNPNAFDAFEKARAEDPSLSEHLMVHKPWIDAVTWTKPGEPGVYRRVPEVIDCWFDSGCMPFAQWGYPHAGAPDFEGCFPADFITEAVDQTRGWFYSLLTISTLLFPERPMPHPFRHCLVLGHITDAKGKKLSKRDKNYTDPLVLMDNTGADAVRWALFANTAPGLGTRFGDQAASDAVRELLLKIWNCYSFLVTYANIDGWTPATKRPPLAERAALDRWLLAELDATTRTVRHALDAYRSHVAARELTAFVDALSNWYVRRSRDRFWAGGDSADKRAAFATLYEALVDLTKLAAPFVPFVTEALYDNLVRKHEPASPESVHLADYPIPSADRVDDALRREVATVREIVTLGQRVRNDQKIKTRQPLSRAILVVAGEADRAALDRFGDAIREELNVKEIERTTEPRRYVEFQLVPNFRALGPKLGKKMPACKQVLAKADGSALHALLEKTGSITIEVEGEPITLGPEEIEIRLTAKEHFAAAAAGGCVVILDTRVDDALRREGLAREVINRVQRARKDLDLPFEARIRLRWQADDGLATAIATHEKEIARETLAERFERVDPGANASDASIEGMAMRFSIEVSPA